MKHATIIFIVIATLAFSCNKSPEKETQTPKPTTENKGELKKSSDTIYISTALQGQAKRMNILQQKVMFRAKKQLADSIATLQQLFGDTLSNSPGNYEVSLHDIHVVEEGIRYPNKNNQDEIEAYITIAMKYHVPIPKIPHTSCKR
ncbi:hypothetical protein L21SP5_00755 [Salinivirga cyanobacteriivorans]|uniref:Uncharacterized protein n=2 Tax=Salinivirga TaxID=1970191 RepID=A0A0S2HWF8_9BACT|nr:hypothetical protein [Salinivirga cyanobacteriivorans]ALO14427.1 hypothetical protein L21SP5_00755 [Salinivirga cyanobacteriivorans]